jgi:AcrR family transcriptional regulator
VTEKGRRRRDLILRAATRLFDEHGFHATGIDDIGEGAGITGPGVYRHFAGKDEILIEVFDGIWRLLRVGLDEAAERPPREALTGLIQQHVEFAVDRRAEMALLQRQLANLPSDYQRRAEANRDRYEAVWVDAVSALFPRRTEADCRLRVRATLWMINSYALDGHAPDPEPETARRVLTEMAHSVVGLDDRRSDAPESPIGNR